MRHSRISSRTNPLITLRPLAMLDSNRNLFFLATICAFCVANIYYSQPMLGLIAQEFGGEAGSVSVIATIVQLSYAAGLVVFVPLGDRLSRRGLLVGLITLNALGSLCAACSTSLFALGVSNIVIGMTSVGGQIIIPAVSLYARENRRGHAMGIVTSGLLAGVLIARALSGIIGEYEGWRAMYVVATVINLALVPFAMTIIPKNVPDVKEPYATFMKSLWHLAKQPELHLPALSGALMFGSFSALWGSLALLAGQAPYHLNSAQIGAFGFAGLIGTLSAPFIGKLADKIGARRVVLSGASLNMLAFMLIAFTTHQLFFLIIGMIILDLGGRAGLVGNQIRALSLDPRARSRLNTVFMSIYFLGGAVGTNLGASVGAHYGWFGIAGLGLFASFSVIGLNFVSRPKSALSPAQRQDQQ
ncbi:MFS transporter [Agrobacterium vitis]|nr:MFS transporter [Agrobacterium vitis]